MARIFAALAVVSAAALLLTACGGGSEPEAEPETTPAASSATVQVANVNGEEILADGEGRSLYLFEQDGPGTSACEQACAETWPPLTVAGDATGGDGVDAGLLGTIERADGTRQVTYADRPLYLYSGDAEPGETNGAGIDDAWYLVSPAGEPVESGSGGNRYGGY